MSGVSLLLLSSKEAAPVKGWLLQVKANSASEPSHVFGGGGGGQVERSGVSFLFLPRKKIA